MATILGIDPRAAAGLAPPKHLTPQDQALLARAPRQATTRVTVRSYDIPWLPGPHEHMYAEYDDGQEQYIFRGGPTRQGVRATVTPARQSRDFGRGQRVLYEAEVPGSAREAVWPARRMARRMEDAGAPYGGAWSNSNSAVGDLTEAQLGVRVGDRLTPGWDTPIRRFPSWLREAPFDMLQWTGEGVRP